ncbi:alkylglycerol monooxygenase-like isoform X2 [Argiope bruennichi]|uniref:alkylglycerol monooxygenase-like isoform X2 n=1 Tax=Argiope bruennichi TaxID=94029 RepID=UPI0024942025|nr:alkylglycerol monooxygenase-like isoform X2 [Argiope bruennichi]
MEVVQEAVKRFGYLFYVMDPRAHNYEKIDQVKDYYKEVAPFFLVTVLLEQVIRFYQKKPLWRLSDTISNTFHGFLMEFSKIPFKGAEVWVYAWIYKNYRLIELPWDSPWTWIACWFITDFCYYWMHRMIHQVNILWAIHETHHTPEDMMFTSPMRNHIFLLPIHWITYLPMALAIPPTTYLVHYQISIIYQYWLHSEIIDKLPAPLEYMLSTPSHHRAHHGRNRRYIDKNFGGFLIIWDRIFGTFEPEDPEEKPLYGCTTQMKSYNPLIIQTRHFRNIWNRFWEIEGIGNKLSVIFKGPGWSPGKPWTGNIEDIPHVLSKLTTGTSAAFIAYSCISMGFMLDNSRYAPPFEFFRCILYFVLDKIIFPEVRSFGSAPVIVMYANRTLAALSIVFWISLYLYENLRTIYKEKTL